ncbi:MAG: hypothetical protein RQ930_01945 [Candidatus Aenigmarchaeota archaeon]|nr:hypothetical protein [Candidatus Aenigmarchaeota archaeon]
MELLSFEEFEKYYDKIKNDENKHELFYCSLFDITSIDERQVGRRMKEFREIEKDVIEKIRFVFNPLFKKKKIENFEEFMKKNVYADRLCRLIIKKELEKKRLNAYLLENMDLKTSEITIEIKRIISGSNFLEYVEDIVEKYTNKNEKIIVLLIFPQFENENYERISQLIEIYYIVEEYLKLKIQNDNIRVLCQYITKKCTKNYSLFKLIERLTEVINCLKRI